jgi:hypothetical protein
LGGSILPNASARAPGAEPITPQCCSKWRNRLLLLFAPAADDPLFIAQQDELAAHRTGLIERELRVFVLFETTEGEGDSQVVTAAQAAGLDCTHFTALPQVA